ncbi:class I SAM-dependent methyltransferase [Cyanobacteria bacterium FACHB-472]|nr:class I SAM-dependent methyltransferase [Cyanobacteria bacterium FACHB-472]
MFKKLKEKVYQLKGLVQLQVYSLHLRQKLGKFSHDYEKYLNAQLRRSLGKKYNPLQMHAKLIVDKIAELNELSQSRVLCIGCRNTAEINYFRSKGAEKVVGIDLFSSSPDITIMDMHKMTFPDNHFDIIYSAHSLEHSYDVHKVVNEIIRVARPGAIVAVEVPVQYKISSTDLVDFGNLENLHAIFEPHISQVLWCEQQSALSPKNEQGTAIIRSIFQVNENREVRELI